MEKYNIVFVDTECSHIGMLGRNARDFLLREFADFKSASSRIVKLSSFKDEELIEDGVNVLLPLDMPLVKKEDILSVERSMRQNNVGFVRLGAKDAFGKICIGRAKDTGVFSNDKCFLRIGDAKMYNVVYNHLKARIINDLLDRGVLIVDGNTTFIDDTAVIESGAIIYPYTRIEGNTVIMSEAKICGSYIKDSVIENGASVEMSHLICSKVGANTTVGPFARLRGAKIDEHCRIGDFVEVKASHLRDGVKASHLCYIGDADVGEKTNVGCGTVFCNYDGASKHKTTVGSECFIGANTNLIAPVVVGDNAFIAAGTTVTRDIEDGSFTIGRVRQDTKIKKTE